MCFRFVFFPVRRETAAAKKATAAAAAKAAKATAAETRKAEQTAAKVAKAEAKMYVSSATLHSFNRAQVERNLHNTCHHVQTGRSVISHHDSQARKGRQGGSSNCTV